MTKFENAVTANQISAPDLEKPILITFFNKSFNGETSRNSFNGQYLIGVNDDLIFLEFGTTDVAETHWGVLFYDAINKSYDMDSKNFKFSFSIDSEILKIEYAELQFMYFKKINF